MNDTITVQGDGAGKGYAATCQKLDEHGMAYGTVPQPGDVAVQAGAASWVGYRPELIDALARRRQADSYEMPADPMDELNCESCQ